MLDDDNDDGDGDGDDHYINVIAICMMTMIIRIKEKLEGIFCLTTDNVTARKYCM